MKDWLGNDLNVGDRVVYTSKSTNVGMVLGEITYIDTQTIKIKPLAYSGIRKTTKIIVLHKGDGAFKAVTRYFGELLEREGNVNV
jgi:hypothetical protein